MKDFNEHINNINEYIAETIEELYPLHLFKVLVKASCEKKGLYPWLNPDKFLGNLSKTNLFDIYMESFAPFHPVLQKVFDCRLYRLRKPYGLESVMWTHNFGYIPYSEALKVLVNNDSNLKNQVEILRQQLLEKVAEPLPEDNLNIGFYLVKRPYWDWNRDNDSNVRPYVLNNEISVSQRVELNFNEVTVCCPISHEQTDVDSNTFLGKVAIPSRWTISAGMGEPISTTDPQEIVEEVSPEFIQTLNPLVYGGFQMHGLINGYAAFREDSTEVVVDKEVYRKQQKLSLERKNNV
jgi:hypothetical protein